jgi:hypothetical protein
MVCQMLGHSLALVREQDAQQRRALVSTQLSQLHQRTLSEAKTLASACSRHCPTSFMLTMLCYKTRSRRSSYCSGGTWWSTSKRAREFLSLYRRHSRSRHGEWSTTTRRPSRTRSFDRCKPHSIRCPACWWWVDCAGHGLSLY